MSTLRWYKQEDMSETYDMISHELAQQRFKSMTCRYVHLVSSWSSYTTSGYAQRYTVELEYCLLVINNRERKQQLGLWQ